jgi:uncharacterized membrane protein
MEPARWLSAAATGAIATYLLDPRSGRRRRALLRDATEHAARAAASGLARATTDLEHRAQGAVSHARGALRAKVTDDSVLVARVRSRLGRVTGLVHGISIASENGIVQLTGQVLADEEPKILRAVRMTRGVRDVIANLDVRPRAEEATLASAPRVRRRRQSWRPATRLLVGTSGATASLWGLQRGGPIGLAVAAGGAAAILRSATNRSIGELMGVSARPPGITVQKTIAIRAPVEDVFRVFTAFETFPRFMPHVENVEELTSPSPSRWRFLLRGPTGKKVALDCELLELVPNELVVWGTTGGSAVASRGSARFESVGPRSTRVTLRLTYRPRAGLVGHGIASLLHADAEHEFAEDLLRLQSLLEHGKATGREGQISLEELAHGPA